MKLRRYAAARALRVGAGGSYFASPVLGDGKIYLAGENGTVVVLRNSANYEELARNDMGESILATPAIADGRLLIRMHKTVLHCRGIKSIAAATQT